MTLARWWPREAQSANASVQLLGVSKRAYAHGCSGGGGGGGEGGEGGEGGDGGDGGGDGGGGKGGTKIALT